MATEARIFGNPVRIVYGSLKVGTGDLTTPEIGFQRAIIEALSGDTGTYGEMKFWCKTAGGVLYATTIFNPITQTVSYSMALPIGLPAGAGYVLSSAGAASPLQLQWLNPALLGTNHWQRVGNQLSPATAGDYVSIPHDTYGSWGLYVGNDSVGATTAITARQAGLTGATQAVHGTVASADNSAYGGGFDKTLLGNYADNAELGGAPANPDAGKWRLYFLSDGVYVVDDAGNTTGPLIDASGLSAGTWAFGDGHDGALTKADGSTTTLTRDMYYSAVTLSANSKVNTAGYRLFCSGTITVAAGSEIYCKGGAAGNGGNAAGSTPGAAGTAGATSNAAATFHAGTAGGVGLIGGAVDNAGTIGTVGTAVTGSIYATGTSSQGGAGGNGGGGKLGGAVGSAGANTELVALAGGQLRDLMQLMTGAYLNRTAFTLGYWQSQAGCGSGGSGAGGAFMPLPSVSGAGGGSGGSGGNGGVLFIAASAITCGGSLNANGGAGGNGGNGGNGVLGGGLGAHGGGGGGGGAGGCGGTVILVYRTYLLTGAGTCTATGGAGGALGALGTGAGIGANGANGTAGSAGDDGLVLQYVVP